MGSRRLADSDSFEAGGGEAGGDEIRQIVITLETLHDAKRAEFALEVETVAALHLDRGAAVGESRAQAVPASCGQWDPREGMAGTRCPTAGGLITQIGRNRSSIRSVRSSPAPVGG